MQLQTNNSPFSEEQAQLINQLLSSLTMDQKVWLSGYITATLSADADSPSPAIATTVLQEEGGATQEMAAVSPVTETVTILVGSHTGNGLALAEEFSQRLTQENVDVTVENMSEVKPKVLKDVHNLLVIVSTHGEGDPPDNTMSFYEAFHSRKAPKMDGTKFSVLALGDTSYEFFCQTGKDFDKRLEELGGERIHERVDCDVDFEEDARTWFQAVLNKLKDSSAPATGKPKVEQPINAAQAPVYSRSNPYHAEILDIINLNGQGSTKETLHVELSLEDSNLEFEPGDSIGIYPENDPTLVNELIQEMGWNPDETVAINKQGDIRSLRHALISHFEITVLTKPLMQKAASFSNNDQLKQLLEDDDKLRTYLEGRDLLDLLRDFKPWKASASDFVSILRKIPPRLYSIASSQKANDDEVHLTIGTVRYDAHGRSRLGVTSGQCAERKEPGDTLPIFVQRNPNFRLPEDPDAPIIMIGPGTGIAPFRAFLEEREKIGANGKSWLFFGDQHFRTDFLYQVEWQRWLKEGVLTKMDVAFSRDQEEKIYVQHRMLEKSKAFHEWLLEGAVIYVCGDEKRMATDVHNAIKTILQQEGALSEEEADVYLMEMQQQKRYQRDVY